MTEKTCADKKNYIMMQTRCKIDTPARCWMQEKYTRKNDETHTQKK